MGLKIGRNDPCPCGSGKKYKKCCGLLGEQVDISQDPFTRYNQLLTAAKLKLDQYYSQRIKKLRKDLQGHYLRFTVQAVLPKENESIFSDWLWFGAQVGERPTLGEDYLKENGDYLEPAFKEALDALNSSYLSVYEVIGAEDQYLMLEDLFLGTSEKILLQEPWELDLSQTRPLLLGRLVRLQTDCLFSGMVLILQNKSGEKDFLCRHTVFLSELYELETADFLKQNQELLYGLFDHALKQVMVNFDHMEAAEFDVETGTLILNALAQSGEWEFVHDTEGYHWYRVRSEVNGYVRLALGKEDLIWSAEVLDDIELMRSLLHKALPALTTMVVQNRFGDQPPSQDFYSLWFLMIKDREAENWLHTPHAELDDRTPASLLEEDKTRLEAMLNQDLDTSPEGQAFIEYLKKRIS